MDHRAGRDFSRNVALKENYAFIAADAAGAIEGGEHGFYHRDTRFLSRYRWGFGEAELLMADTPRPDRLLAHYGHIVGHMQLVGIRRELHLDDGGFRDRLVIENSSLEPREIALELQFGADFADLFEARGWEAPERAPAVATIDGAAVTWRYRARDGLEMGTRLEVSPTPRRLDPQTARFDLAVEPGERTEVVVRVEIDTPLQVPSATLGYPQWRARFGSLAARAGVRDVLATSIDDLRALLLFTQHGPIPAAGIPWYVAAFGRDSLLTAHMLLDHAPDVAEGTLRYLAAHQGTVDDPFRAEQPGKIMHELRFGEMSRTDQVPFGPYFGTVDATALWVMLLHAYGEKAGTVALAAELRPALEAALAWMTERGDGNGDGLLEFAAGDETRGLRVQSWKDSPDSMSHTNGTLADGPLAVSEVQGYAYAAYRGAAAIFRALAGRGSDGDTSDASGSGSGGSGSDGSGSGGSGSGDSGSGVSGGSAPYGAAADATRAADRWDRKAQHLQEAFHRAFWLADLETYAMALDGAGRPLRVLSSDAGQLLWTGIVPEGSAGALVRTLFRPELFSGWGIRTLGSGELRYNPVSYHNGSVWPHDTALIAGGLARYGFRAEARRLRQAIFDLAGSQRDRRLPELVGGYPREDERRLGGVRPIPPVPYPVACRPQAWDAAALVYLASLDL